jgi:lipopolysaccharide transport system permease protein
LYGVTPEVTMEIVRKINSEPDSFAEYLKNIWSYKSLIWVFAKRDLKVKYAQTVIGLGWSILQPLTALLIYSFFFGFILNWNANNLPFPVYVLSGLIGWNFFSYIIYQGSSSIQDSGNTIKKIYFPKSILPLSKVVVALIELVLSLGLFLPLLLFYKISISWHIVLFPLAILFNSICALMPVFWIATFAYKKRDLFHLLPYLVTFGIWFTPIFFTPQILPYNLAYLMKYNPMANVVDFWRWVLFNYGDFELTWVFNFLILLILCIMGMYFYNKKESEFSDYV